jgi:hypothetical protein
LAGSAPELNPIAGLWQLRKRVEVRHMIGHPREKPRTDLRLARARLRYPLPYGSGPPKMSGYAATCSPNGRSWRIVTTR